MILKELEQIVADARAGGAADFYIRNSLKEYLQIYVLYFIYSSAEYSQKLIFTGGTCLRHFYGLDRLSEDVDFDFNKAIESEQMVKDLEKFFKKRYQYSDVNISLKQQGQQVLLKFPVLKSLGLARGTESDLLYIKIDLSKNPSKHFSVITSSKSQYGFNFVATHYDLPSLMAGKIHAVLKRQHLKGRANTTALKGRDYYDLLWYLKKNVKPNLSRLADMLGEKIKLSEIAERIDQKVELATTKLKKYFEMDLTPLLKNTDMVSLYVKNYKAEYERVKLPSLSL